MRNLFTLLLASLSQALARYSMVDVSNTYLVDLENYFNFQMDVQFDIGYGTSYQANLHPDDRDLQQMSYDFQVDSKLEVSLYFGIL